MEKRCEIWSDVESRRRLKRVALAILGSSALAEEIVQEAYLRLLENNVGAVENPSTWLLKVTRNLALDLARRRLRERKLLMLLPAPDLFQLTDGRHATESRLAELVSCLLHVSDSKVAAIVLLHTVFGMSYEDIAIVCGRSTAACRQAGSRALRKCINSLNAGERFDDTFHTDMYVHAILDASTAPLIDNLSVTSPLSIQSVAVSYPSRYCDAVQATTGRTRQVLVLSADGVRWALVLEGRVLCFLGCAMYATSTQSIGTSPAHA